MASSRALIPFKLALYALVNSSSSPPYLSECVNHAAKGEGLGYSPIDEFRRDDASLVIL